MRKYRFQAVMVGLLLTTTTAHASNVDVRVNLGTPPPVVVREAAPPPTRTVIVEDVPDFVYPPSLGFYVAVGYPHDLFFLDGFYYLYRDNVWHRSYEHNGPWKAIKYKSVPYGLRKHKYETIRNYRAREYALYQRDRDHYRGKHFRPDHEWQERRKHERNEYKDHRKAEQREYKEHRKDDRNEWKEEQRGQGRGHGKGRGRDD